MEWNINDKSLYRRLKFGVTKVWQIDASLPNFTVNDESLEWLKFGGFGELIKFAKLSSTN